MSSNTPPPPPNQQTQPSSSSLPVSGTMNQLQQFNQQMQGLEQRYQGLAGIGRRQSAQQNMTLPGVPPLQNAAMQGASGVAELGQQLAERYGIAGRGQIIDPSGNFTRMPNSADEAAKFQFISQALTNYRTEQAQKASISTLQAGIGLVQNRGRGSLAAMQSGMYQSLAQAQQADVERISNMQPDFSYFIEKEMQDRREALQRDMLRAQKKKAKYGMIGSILGAGVGLLAGGPAGAGIGAQLGSSLGGGAGGAY